MIEQHNEALRIRVSAFRDANRLTLLQLGQRFGIGETSMSKWLAGKFDGNLKRLEGILQTGLEALEERERVANTLFDTPAAELIRRIAAKLKRTCWIGAIYGNAGIGKTCGSNLVLLRDLSAIYVKTVCYKRHKGDLIQAIFDQVATPEQKATRCNKIAVVENSLRNSGRLIIVDDAHLLNRTGRQFYCDLNDTLKVAILLIGNPEMFAAWRELPQQASRLKLCEKACLSNHIGDGLERKDAEAQVLGMLQAHAPAVMESAETLVIMKRCHAVLKGDGHLRSLETTLKLSSQIMSKGFNTSWEAAWDAAERQQVRNMNLQGEAK